MRNGNPRSTPKLKGERFGVEHDAVPLARTDPEPTEREKRLSFLENHAVFPNRTPGMRRLFARKGDEAAVRTRIPLQIGASNLDPVDRILRPPIRRREDEDLVRPLQIRQRDRHPVNLKRRFLPVDAAGIRQPKPERSREIRRRTLVQKLQDRRKIVAKGAGVVSRIGKRSLLRSAQADCVPAPKRFNRLQSHPS